MFGGGSDFPKWYLKHGGQVLSTSIDKYCYTTVRYLPPFFDHKYRIRYTQREETQLINQIQHPSVRECLNWLNMESVEVLHTADIPAKSGIGSSAAFTVGLLHALHSLQGRVVSKRQLAKEAIHIEQNLIQESVGSQDQIACAFGGLNKIEFKTDGDFNINPVPVHKNRLKELKNKILFFFTGFSRYSHNIEKDKIKTILEKEIALKRMSAMVDESIAILNSDRPINEIGELLKESWGLKKSLSNKVTTKEIDEICNSIDKYVIGQKLCGSGGGGFLMLFVEPENQAIVKEILKKLVLVPFDFDNTGSQIIYYSG